MQIYARQSAFFFGNPESNVMSTISRNASPTSPPGASSLDAEGLTPSSQLQNTAASFAYIIARWIGS